MKTNKKTTTLLAIILMLTLAFGFSACKDDKKGADTGGGSKQTAKADSNDPYEIYKMAQEKLAGEKGVSMKTKVKITTDPASNSDFEMDGSAIITQPAKEKVEIQVNQKMKIQDQDISVTLYFKDGYVYTDAAGMKFKAESDIDKALSEVLPTANEVVKKEAIKESSVKTVGGNREVTLVMDGAIFKEQLKQQTPAATEINMSDTTGTFLIDKDGNLISETVSMKADILEDKEKKAVVFTMTLTDIQAGDVEIKFPNLNEYKEQPWMDTGKQD